MDFYFVGHIINFRHFIDYHGDNFPGKGEFLESKLFDYLEHEMNRKNDYNLSNISRHLHLDIDLFIKKYVNIHFISNS